MHKNENTDKNKTQIAIAVFDKCAHLYQEKFMDVSLYADALDLFCDSIGNENARILELACGPGNITKHLLSKHHGYKLTGTDLAPNMIRLAKSNNPEADFQLMDCRDIGTLNEKFDAIICGFCLPYLSREEALRLIRHAADIMNPGGVMYISTMEDDYSNSGLRTGRTGDQVFIHYHEAGYLTDALLENGFSLVHMDRKVYPAGDGTLTTDLIIIAQTRVMTA